MVRISFSVKRYKLSSSDDSKESTRTDAALLPPYRGRLTADVMRQATAWAPPHQRALHNCLTLQTDSQPDRKREISAKPTSLPAGKSALLAVPKSQQTASRASSLSSRLMSAARGRGRRRVAESSGNKMYSLDRGAVSDHSSLRHRYVQAKHGCACQTTCKISGTMRGRDGQKKE